jgi:hypothetical protein
VTSVPCSCPQCWCWQVVQDAIPARTCDLCMSGIHTGIPIEQLATRINANTGRRDDLDDDDSSPSPEA